MIRIYVSKNGSDKAEGSEKSPFATPARAIDELKKLKSENALLSVEIIIGEGEYHVETLDISGIEGSENAKISLKKEESAKEVVFNGGVTIPESAFEYVTDEKILERLDPSVRGKVKAVDLKSFGLDLKKIGNQYAFGAYHNEDKYDNRSVGNNAELFLNGKRLTVARWPNKGFTHIKKVIDVGDAYEYPPQVYHPERCKIRNPKGGSVILEDEAIERIKNWKEPQKAWTFGYYFFDWADASSPVGFVNTETGEMGFAYVPSYGYKEGQYFYFFNVLEELDREGEYYIDRENMVLYCYIPETDEEKTFTLTAYPEPILSGKASYTEFDGITFKGIRGDIAKLSGEHITFRNCVFAESYGTALTLDGSDNLIYNCETNHLGKSGFILSGGDRNTLTPGNNTVENCKLHDFGEVFRTYQTGATVSGCGNRIIHNEVYSTPHMALSFGGNDNLIAFNYIHDTSYEVDDGGSLYAGRNWTTYGNVIKYNLFENIVGINGHRPQAIYLDDSLSGITMFGNIINNCGGFAFQLGGGHDLVCENNIIRNAGIGIFYDQRSADGEWASVTDPSKGAGEGMYSTLDTVPIFSELWTNRYPSIKKLILDKSKSKDPDFIGNPCNSSVRNNVYIDCETNELFWKLVPICSDCRNNVVAAVKDISEDGYNLTQSFIDSSDLCGFESIPVNKIGRYKE